MYKVNAIRIIMILLICLIYLSCKKEVSNSTTPATAGTETNKKHDHEMPATSKVFASGLENPRGLKFGPNGNLYVAEGGNGGGNSFTDKLLCEQVPFPVGPYHGGLTGGRVTIIDPDGKKTILVSNLPSSHANEIIGGDVEGIADVAFIDNQLYALLAGAGCSHGVINSSNGVVKINSNGTWSLIANLSDWFHANPVKNPEPDDFEPDGTPYSMINVRGDLYVIEPNHGDFVKIKTSGEINRVVDISATQGHIVPTALAYHGNFFVGNLNRFPIIDGSSNIYKITPSGQIKIWATGLTTVLGLAFDDDDLYVLENTTGNNIPPLPTPGTGTIVKISEDGKKEIILTGLNLPTGITFGPDGKLYVSNWGFSPFSTSGGGEIIQVDLHRRHIKNN